MSSKYLATQELLTGSPFMEAGQLGPIRYRPAPIRKIDPALTGLTLRQIPQSDLRAFKGGLTRRATDLTSDSFSDPLLSLASVSAAHLMVGALDDWEFSVGMQGIRHQPTRARS